jgi:hypothetical protein
LKWKSASDPLLLAVNRRRSDFASVAKRQKKLDLTKTVPIACLDENEQTIAELKLAADLFELRKRGYSNYELSQQFGISIACIKEIENKWKQELRDDVQADIAEWRSMALAQIADVIKRCVATATDPHESGRIKQAAEQNILRSIAEQAKILCLDKSAPEAQAIQNNTMIWLAREDEYIRSIVDKTPVEIVGVGDSGILDLSFDEP